MKYFKGFYKQKQLWNITTFKCINVCSMWSRVTSRQNGRPSNRKWETPIWFILRGTQIVQRGVSGTLEQHFSRLCLTLKSNICPFSLRTFSASSGIKTFHSLSQRHSPQSPPGPWGPLWPAPSVHSALWTENRDLTPTFTEHTQYYIRYESLTAVLFGPTWVSAAWYPSPALQPSLCRSPTSVSPAPATDPGSDWRRRRELENSSKLRNWVNYYFFHVWNRADIELISCPNSFFTQFHRW